MLLLDIIGSGDQVSDAADRVGKDATSEDHGEDGVDLLLPRDRGNVSVPHSRHRSERPIQTRNIALKL